tara:strand:- start:123 stop:545 length:423 start_codon:yes stop_codon:yes gene_type:complete
MGILSTTVLAHVGAVGVVKERMESMKTIGAAMKQIKAMINGRADFVPERVKELAGAIADHSGTAINRVFPVGSNFEPSQAKPAIWENWQVFADLAVLMERQALQLAADAVTSGAVAKAYQELSKTCKSCHKKFRLKKKRR